MNDRQKRFLNKFNELLNNFGIERASAQFITDGAGEIRHAKIVFERGGEILAFQFYHNGTFEYIETFEPNFEAEEDERESTEENAKENTKEIYKITCENCEYGDFKTTYKNGETMWCKKYKKNVDPRGSCIEKMKEWCEE